MIVPNLFENYLLGLLEREPPVEDRDPYQILTIVRGADGSISDANPPSGGHADRPVKRSQRYRFRYVDAN